MLKPQDVVLAMKLLSKEQENWSQGSLAQELVMSASEVNAGLKRLAYTQLIEKHDDGRKWKVVRPAIAEFLIYGIKYVFPAEKGAPCSGILTSMAAVPLKQHIQSSGLTPVWPYKGAKNKGFALQPLYPSSPKAALADSELYEWLVIVDALRDNENEQRDIAELALKDKLAGRQRVEPDSESSETKDDQMDLLSL